MSPRRVLVTGTGATGVGASVIAALQNNPEASARWEPVAADACPFSWGLYAARGGGMLAPWAHQDGYLDWVIGAVKETGAAAVIPGTEAETALLAEHRDEIPVPVIANGAELMPLMADKTRAQAKLAELGLPVIPSYRWERYPEAAGDFGFPLVVKPSRNSSGSRDVHLVTGLRQLDALDSLVPPGTIIQPYLGDAGSEHTVGVMSSRSGKVTGSIVMRRALTGLSLKAARDGAAVSTGFSQGTIIAHPVMREFCEDLAAALGSTGPLNLQLRVHKGEFFVFEIHPRFSFSTSIRASAGFNEPDMALRDALDGEQVECPDYRVNVAAIRVLDHILVPAGEMLG